MKLTTALRTPYGATTVVGSAANGRVSGLSLDRATVLAKLAVVMLCAARVGADWLRGYATIEGGVALALLVAFTMWLVAEATGGATRSASPAQGATPYRSPRPRGAGGGNVRAS
jgi:hypothetical protein